MVVIHQKNGVGVLETSNRASVQKNTEIVAGITSRMDNHESVLNTNAHAIGSIGGLQTALDGKEPAFSKNTAFNKNYGTTAGTTCQGDDSRLSDARTPTAHTHTTSDIAGGYTGSLTVVTAVDFFGQTTTTATINISNGIITSIM